MLLLLICAGAASLRGTSAGMHGSLTGRRMLTDAGSSETRPLVSSGSNAAPATPAAAPTDNGSMEAPTTQTPTTTFNGYVIPANRQQVGV